ncbi:hypothetical protein [Alloyangia pacifica]|uniref:hypothetical protein n=1 Tax=Alloyangia pacifica TaxID=311180 RepID=UPI001CFCA0AE|nr:hypothetical protein [Alloyangia pacifica]
MLDPFHADQVEAEGNRSAMAEIDMLSDVRDRAHQEARALRDSPVGIVFAAIASVAEDSIRSLSKAAKAAEAY